MKRFKALLITAILVFVLLVITGAFFTISETQQAVILHLGKPVRIIVGNRTPEELAELQGWMDENAPGVPGRCRHDGQEAPTGRQLCKVENRQPVAVHHECTDRVRRKIAPR